MSCLSHKQGDTFGRPMLLRGTDFDFTDWDGFSQLRTESGELVANLEFEWLDVAERKWRITFAGDTAEWNYGKHIFDVQFVNRHTGEKTSLPNLYLVVTRDNTIA